MPASMCRRAPQCKRLEPRFQWLGARAEMKSTDAPRRGHPIKPGHHEREMPAASLEIQLCDPVHATRRGSSDGDP